MPNRILFSMRRRGARFVVASLAALLGPCLFSGGAAHADAKAALPASVGNFRMTHPAQIFSPSTLENHIDGGAESVKHYQFKQCDYAEYAPGGRGNQLITVDIYEMGTPLDAYGYYSFQLSPSARTVRFVPVGAEGYQTRDALTFWKGDYYVTITITAAGSPPAYQAALPQFGRALAAKLPGVTQAPPLVKVLPPGFTPHSEKYERVNVAGQSFLVNAVSASYPAAGQQAEMFVASYMAPAAAKAAYDQYVAYLNKPLTLAVGAKATPLKGVGQTAVVVKTRFGGTVVTALQGKYVIGLRKARDAATAANLVKAAAAKAK